MITFILSQAETYKGELERDLVELGDDESRLQKLKGEIEARIAEMKAKIQHIMNK